MKVFLGTTKESFTPLPKQRIYIEKHKWDCDWYWGFGYIGNPSIHTHFDSIFLNGRRFNGKHYTGDLCDPIEMFIKSRFTKDEWYIIRDLFIQAYGLKKAAEIYQYGGHQINKAFRFPNEGMSDRINEDLRIILNKVWQRLEQSETFFVEGEIR